MNEEQKKQEMLKVMKYSDKILELIDNQERNDETSLTRSDLQGAVDAIVMNILRDK